MKTLFFALVLTVSSVAAMAQQGIKWMTWDEAVAAAKKQPKPIFVDTYTDWCGWCKTMDRNTFAHPVIAKYMNEHYYAVKLNAEMKDTINFNGYTFVNPNPTAKRSTHQLAASLLDNKMSYPSFVFLNSNFERMHIQPGYLGPTDFEKVIRYFAEAVPKGQSQEQFLGEYRSMIPEPEN